MITPVPTDLPASVPSRIYREEPPPRRTWLHVFIVFISLGLAVAAVGLVWDLVTAETLPPSTMRAPETLGGRPRTTDDEWAKSNAQFVKDTFGDGATSVVLEVYGDNATEDQVMVFAAAGAIRSPGRALIGLFESMETQGYERGEFTPIDPGSLGGMASCGHLYDEDGQTVVCAWASTSSNGMIEWYYGSLEQARAEFAGLRAEIESQG